ncbi:MAG: universal stress protein, partial [Dehalococcoidia bacterium]|nr:universal stress protein [Dehalococcoidia bacterium]
MMQKILVPLDGSDFAEGIIDEVAELAAGGRAEVVLFQVGTLPQELVVDNGRTIYLDEQLGWVESGIKDYLRMVERRLKARGLRVESA